MLSTEEFKNRRGASKPLELRHDMATRLLYRAENNGTAIPVARDSTISFWDTNLRTVFCSALHHTIGTCFIITGIEKEQNKQCS